MERADFMKIVGPLGIALGANFNQLQWAVYQRALEDIPVRWLTEAVSTAVKQDRKFMPRPGELRALATAALERVKASLKRPDCEGCCNSGWREELVDGVNRAYRCDCVTQHRAIVAALGTIEQPGAQREESQQLTIAAYSDAPEPFDWKAAQLGADR